MNICERLTNIDGVTDCKYNAKDYSIAIYYGDIVKLETVKIKVSKTIADIGLSHAINRIDFFNIHIPSSGDNLFF